jgi:predicted amidophosphoribosyltransferase
MKREVRIFVCNDSPWISSYCPQCGKRVYQNEHFCKECGQELSVEDYNKVLDDGGCSIDLQPVWTEYIVTDEMNKIAFVKELRKLEEKYRINSKDPIVKILRNEYIKTATENLKEIK